MPQSQDPELARVRDGYPALAAYISRDPDHEAYIFRTFGQLGARKLLHLQCQLTELEHELNEMDEEARRGHDSDTCQALRRHETLSMLAKDKRKTEERV
jgi:hypothetical protein